MLLIRQLLLRSPAPPAHTAAERLPAESEISASGSVVDVCPAEPLLPALLLALLPAATVDGQENSTGAWSCCTVASYTDAKGSAAPNCWTTE